MYTRSEMNYYNNEEIHIMDEQSMINSCEEYIDDLDDHPIFAKTDNHCQQPPSKADIIRAKQYNKNFNRKNIDTPTLHDGQAYARVTKINGDHLVAQNAEQTVTLRLIPKFKRHGKNRIKTRVNIGDIVIFTTHGKNKGTIDKYLPISIYNELAKQLESNKQISLIETFNDQFDSDVLSFEDI